MNDKGISDDLAPGLLIAVPQLQDPNFQHAVVLMLENNENGSIGVVLNRESPLFLKDLCADHAIKYGGEPGKLVRTGGPVQPEQGLMLYGEEHAAADGHEVVPGLHVSASRETLGRLCGLSEGRFHCYSGYAGWGPLQVENEIRMGSWIAAPIDPALVLDIPPKDVWRRGLALLGIDPANVVPGNDVQA